jgi:hypothetical protein
MRKENDDKDLREGRSTPPTTRSARGGNQFKGDPAICFFLFGFVLFAFFLLFVFFSNDVEDPERERNFADGPQETRW